MIHELLWFKKNFLTSSLFQLKFEKVKKDDENNDKNNEVCENLDDGD